MKLRLLSIILKSKRILQETSNSQINFKQLE